MLNVWPSLPWAKSTRKLSLYLPADLESQATTAGREKMIALHVAQSGRDLTDSDKGDHAKSPGKVRRYSS